MLFRLSPALLAVIFWYAFVMEHVGSGPQWNSVVMANAELCKYNAWTNLLYVQNFFPFEEMVSRWPSDELKNIYKSYLSWFDGFFTVRHAHVSVGLGHATVALGAYPSLFFTIQTHHRYALNGLSHLVICHSSLHSDNEQLSVSRHLSWDFVSTS